MRVGIITFHRLNYGEILQAYALQTTLEHLGHTAEIIDYVSHNDRAAPYSGHGQT